MSVSKSVDLVGSGSSVEDAVQVALDRALTTLEDVTGFEVDQIAGEFDGAQLVFRVRLHVWFTLRERIHG